MDFPTVATAAGLVGNAISALKNARELARDTSNEELNAKINDAYGALLDVRDYALALDEENRKLKLQLAAKAAYVGPVAPHGYFYAADDGDAQQHPICPSCYQASPSRIGFLSPQNNDAERFCALCKGCFHERVFNSSAAMAVTDHDPYAPSSRRRLFRS